MSDMRLNATANINTWIEMAQKAGKGVINPETFYNKQLLDTIRYDADEYMYYKLADTMPIQEKADKLQIRRWAPLQAHTIPLEEGIPPKSDKGSVEKYEIEAFPYGRYMEFSDKVDYAVVDPVIAHYTKEYSFVIMETFDMLAREVLFSVAQKWYANSKSNFYDLTPDDKPTMTDLRLIGLHLKKALVKPRSGNKYLCVASPEFNFDMISDPTVEKYMGYNQTTKDMYSSSRVIDLFDMTFSETLICPTSSEFVKDNLIHKLLYRINDAADGYDFAAINEEDVYGGSDPVVTFVDGYVKDSRTGEDASYIPNQMVWALDAAIADGIEINKNLDPDLGAEGDAKTDWVEFKAQHILIVGKDALVRTGLSGEDQARMFTKPKGSSGVLDPIDQRQSLGFKINSVGFGSTRLEAIVDYICVPTQVNPL